MTAEPCFIRCLVVQRRCGGEIGEVRSGSAKLVPEGWRCIAHEVHGSGFPKNSLMDTFSTSILGRGVGHSDDVIDAQGQAPSLHGFGYELAIIGDKTLEGETGLSSHMFVPKLKHGSGIPLAS